MKTFEELVKKLNEVESLGFVKTHRTGNTGIGKTLEDLLGIAENNVPGPDVGLIELKSARRNSSSLLTLFTKSPLPKSANALLLKEYGYPSAKGNGKKELHTTTNAVSFNNLRGKRGFKIGVRKDKICLISSQGHELCYWDKDTLMHTFEKKLSQLVYVKADFKGRGSKEQFRFNEAWLLSGFNFDNFIKLLKKGTIVVDIRIGQYSDGSPHDHGTAFRVNPNDFDSCFQKRKRII